ncbi:MAG: TonB-dependent receptor [Candidatus Edwardsbacteria bacterium]|nr:TonB-dependent receptor [Candidatus Edwardsbacteria bacterium]MBU1576040.1 TonB-dependent receptor [Candidatus Edwardsbacteria bacterium]MBU2463063.1 TonB-dependent receptor [Candidatus Edwardsbacteria bacterium]MBU2594301.1 TonB-dependent receptor [Candidatus Edwardsbacteria bacterium]
MKKVLFICLMIWFCNITSAQNTISGKVADQSGNPMSGANVFLPEQNKGTATGQTGDYKIENLPNGKIKMQFYFIGFAAEMKTVVLQDSNIVLNIIMNNTPIELPGIVVTGGYVSAQHENAVKIDVIEIRDIALSGTPNFMEALSTVPGVDMIAKGQGVSKPVIRGLSMNDILVMNNGVRIENYQFSENHPLGVDDNNIDKVEIIKGPASLLYGSDAIGGVFNFIKEKPAPIGEILGDYRTQLHSNTLGFNNSLGIKGASEHVFAGFRAGNKTHADYKQGGGDFVPNSRFNEWSFNLNSGYTGKPGTFKIFYDYFKQDLGMTVPPVKPLISEQGRKNEIWYQDLEHQLLSSQNMLYLGKFQWEINAAYQNALRKLQTTLDVPFIEMNLNTITYESKLHLPSDEKTEYIIGLQGMSQNNRNRNSRASQFLPNADINNLGFLGLSQYRFFNKLMLQGGLRYDRYITETFALGTEGAGDYHAPVAKDFTRLTGSVGATCNLIEQLLLRVNVAKAYRAPNLSELTSNGMHGARYEIGSENLNPENACETDISMHYHGEYLSLDLAGFYNQIDDYIYIAPTSDTTAAGVGIYRFSQTNANLLGGEAGLHVHPQSMSWLHLQATCSMVTGKQQNGNYLPFIPAQKIHYEARAEKGKIGLFLHPNIRISALSALRQHHPSPFEAPTDRYTLVNAGLSTDIKISNQCLNISLSVNNIFDTKYFDHLSTLKPMNYYNQGRNICLNLKIPFGITKNE